MKTSDRKRGLRQWKLTCRSICGRWTKGTREQEPTSEHNTKMGVDDIQALRKMPKSRWLRREPQQRPSCPAIGARPQLPKTHIITINLNI